MTLKSDLKDQKEEHYLTHIVGGGQPARLIHISTGSSPVANLFLLLIFGYCKKKKKRKMLLDVHKLTFLKKQQQVIIKAETEPICRGITENDSVIHLLF